LKIIDLFRIPDEIAGLRRIRRPYRNSIPGVDMQILFAELRQITFSDRAKKTACRRRFQHGETWGRLLHNLLYGVKESIVPL